MKTILFQLLISISILSSCSNNEDQKSLKKTTFKVWGNCEMCQNTIQTSLKTKGINSAIWNVDSKIIAIEYDENEIKEGELHRLIASEGYDTQLEKGDDFAYENLHECCKYSRKK